MSGWIGVDLDGTLAMYEGFQGLNHIGAPIPLMVERVKDWLAKGKDVRIMTARVARSQYRPNEEDVEVTRATIKAWCAEHLGVELEVTNQKDYWMAELWDDRAVQVIPNTGKTLAQCIRDLTLVNDALREQIDELNEAHDWHP